MHQQKSRRILLYIFLFLMIGTLNNKNLHNINFVKLNHINIEGFDEVKKIELLEELSYFKFNNLFFLDKLKIKKILSSNELIEKFTVYKNYPSTLNIKIHKASFLAKVKKNQNLFFLGSNGKLIRSNKKNFDVPYIYGNFKNENFFELKKVLDDISYEYNEIENLFFFKSGRWDIELNNGILIKLPKNNIKKSLIIVNDILNNDKQNKIYEIDLRQYNQVIINER